MSSDEVDWKLHFRNLNLKSLGVLRRLPERGKAYKLNYLVKVVCLLEVGLGAPTKNLDIVKNLLVLRTALHEKALHVSGDHRHLT